MNKRLSFPLVLCIAALGVGCDNNGGDCPTGMICLDGATDGGGGGGGDAGPGTDAGPRDGGGPAACGTTGQIAGSCRRGMCTAGLECAVNLMDNWGRYRLNSGTADPDHPGEYIDDGTPSTLAYNFYPNGGQCTRGCTSRADGTDTCDSECASCSDTAGVSRIAGIFGGATGTALRMSDNEPIAADSDTGVCRLNCAFDPATNGGCPTGYTCDPGSNVCVEACGSTEECNAGLGVTISPNGAQVIVDTGAGFTCNTTTGRCEHTPPASAALNSACETNADCPASGVCLIGGYCATYACVDATNTMDGPVTCAGDCGLNGGNNGSICFQGCRSPSDCNPGQGCFERRDSTGTPVPFRSGNTGFCIGLCHSDSECRSSERCQELRPDDPDTVPDESFSVCSPICDPDPTADPAVPDAIMCEAGEVCEKSGTEDYGYCEPLNQICGADGDCHGTQACRIEDGNILGRCEGSCATNTDCTEGGAKCVIFDDMVSTTPPLTRGVCRLPGGACAKSRVNRFGVALQPMLGDAQCIASQHCSQTTATDPPTTGTCVDD